MNGKIKPHAKSRAVGMGRHTDPRLGYFADQRFGFTGTIYEAGECEGVGGTFHPLIFGWMVHVYPFADTDDLKVAFGLDAP